MALPPNDQWYRIRPFRPGEAAALVKLFQASVHVVAASHYDAAQRAAWAPADLDPAEWEVRLGRQHCLVNEQGGSLAGFIAFDGSGYVDLLFTARAHVRRGVATHLYAEAEARLVETGVRALSTHASLVSRPFFERQGFVVVAPERVELDGVGLDRFLMQKTLPPGLD